MKDKCDTCKNDYSICNSCVEYSEYASLPSEEIEHIAIDYSRLQSYFGISDSDWS